MASYTVYFTYDAITYEIVSKMGFGNLSFVTEKEENQIFYRTKLDGAISFMRRDNTAIYDVIESLTQDQLLYCDEVEVQIDKTCEGVLDEEYWMGRFTITNETINRCTCRVNVLPEVVDQYTCLLDNWENETNIYQTGGIALSLVDPAIVSPVFQQDVELIPTAGFLTNTVALNAAAALYDPGGVNPSSFNLYSTPPTAYIAFYPLSLWHQRTDNLVIAANTQVTTTWGYDAWIGGGAPSGFGWVFDVIRNGWFRDFNLATSDTIDDIPESIEFEVMLQKLLDGLDCGSITIVSDFYDINPDATAPANQAYTYAAANYQDLFYTAKDNAKNPLAAVPTDSTRYNLTLDELLSDLKESFNVYWTMDDSGNFRIEHLSYFIKDTIDLDCTAICNIKYDVDIPQRETFQYMDQEASVFFKGSDIIYPAQCSNGRALPHRLTNFSYDVIFIQNNPDEISNDGFVLMATDGSGSIIDSNRPLAFTELHDNLWKWGRYFIEGDMNGSLTTFEDTLPISTTDPIICGCDCTIDANVLVNTSRGLAEIIQITESLRSGRLKITYGYD